MEEDLDSWVLRKGQDEFSAYLGAEGLRPGTAGYLAVLIQGSPGEWSHHPSRSGPTLTWVLIPSVDPKLQDYGERREKGGERREGSVQEPGLAGDAVVGGTHVPSPLTHPMQAGGRAACSLSRASRLLPAPCQSCSGTRSQPVCSQEAALPPAPPAPFLNMCPPHPQRNHHVGRLAHVYPISFYPYTPLCIHRLPSLLHTFLQAPPLHTHL